MPGGGDGWDERKHPRALNGEWSLLADAVLKTASNLRGKARGSSQEGHARYEKQAASELEAAARELTTGNYHAAGPHLQGAHNELMQVSPRHPKLATVKSHIDAHESLDPSEPFGPPSYYKKAARAEEPPVPGEGEAYHRHALYVLRSRELREAVGLVW
jgi:hypothetical protein